MKINTAKKTEISIGVLCFVLGIVFTMLIARQQIQTQKKLTVRILSNAVQSIESSQHLSQSCSNAYDTVTKCVSNLKSCNIDEETKKLDTFNSVRKSSDKEIEKVNIEMKNIIDEVSSNK